MQRTHGVPAPTSLKNPVKPVLSVPKDQSVSHSRLQYFSSKRKVLFSILRSPKGIEALGLGENDSVMLSAQSGLSDLLMAPILDAQSKEFFRFIRTASTSPCKMRGETFYLQHGGALKSFFCVRHMPCAWTCSPPISHLL